MDALLFHPKIVHLPMALGMLMPLIAGGIALAWWRKWLPSRVWVLVVVLQGVLVASGVAALQSGEVDEDRVEQVVPERFIEEHEEAAEVFVGASAAVLGVMLLALAAGRRRPGLPLAAAATAGALVVLGLGYRTGEAGGALVYEHGASAAYAQPGGQHAPMRESHGDRDDDDDDD